MNRSLVGCVMLVSVCWVAAAEEATPSRSEEALEILRKVDAAIKAVSSVRYTVTATPGGAATQFMTPGEGSVVLAGWTGQIPRKFRIDVKGERGGEPVDVTGGGNGDTFFLVDHRTKKAYEDMDPGVLGSSANTLFGLAVLEFVHDAPFDDELGADTVELVGTADVAGVACHEIRVVYSGGRGSSTWFFAKADLLPRRRVQSFQTPQGEATIERTVGGLQVDPPLADSLFVLELPEGYEQIDDFAP